MKLFCELKSETRVDDAHQYFILMRHGGSAWCPLLTDLTREKPAWLNLSRGGSFFLPPKLTSPNL
jgi:hypothetical protein